MHRSIRGRVPAAGRLRIPVSGAHGCHSRWEGAEPTHRGMCGHVRAGTPVFEADPQRPGAWLCVVGSGKGNPASDRPHCRR